MAQDQCRRYKSYWGSKVGAPGPELQQLPKETVVPEAEDESEDGVGRLRTLFQNECPQGHEPFVGGPQVFAPRPPGRAAAIPPAAPGDSPSGFAFMGAPAQEADSFGFVSDMIGAKK